jgi:hypothetical protein
VQRAIAVGPEKGFDVVSVPKRRSKQQPRRNGAEMVIRSGTLGVSASWGPAITPVARKGRSCNKLGSFVVDNISTADVASLLKMQR